MKQLYTTNTYYTITYRKGNKIKKLSDKVTGWTIHYNDKKYPTWESITTKEGLIKELEGYCYPIYYSNFLGKEKIRDYNDAVVCSLDNFIKMDISYERVYVNDDHYTFKELMNNMTAPDFIEYAKDKGLKI